MPRANWEFIGNLPVPLPPYDEQVAIRDFLETYTQSIDNAVEKYRLLIDHLQEYRQALITAAVTGKIDVRRDQRERTNIQDVC
jgi:restriction endonuclease S subunit